MRGALRRIACLAALLLPAGPLRAGECDAAAVRAERAWGLPPGLLQAIGKVESGSWPWSVNEAGAGRTFATPDAAAGWAARRLATGVRSIDVGCFQVNLLHHPDAFATLQDAFDPDSNARAAAAFLVGLNARLHSWNGAAAAYHSATPGLGSAYLGRVLAHWDASGAAAAPRAPGAATAGGLTFIGSYVPLGTLPRILRSPAVASVQASPGKLVRLPDR